MPLRLKPDRRASVVPFPPVPGGRRVEDARPAALCRACGSHDLDASAGDLGTVTARCLTCGDSWVTLPTGP